MVHEVTVPDNVAGVADGLDVFTIRVDKPRRGRYRHSTSTEVLETWRRVRLLGIVSPETHIS